MKKHIKSIVTLTLICAITSILLAFTNSLTAPVIEEAEKAAANESLKVVMPNGEGFEEFDFSTHTLPSSIVAVYKETSGGYVFRTNVTGYSSNMIIMCGVDKDGVVTGATCISSGETLGYEKTYGEKFPGEKSDTIDDVDTISGATKTTEAYKNAIKDSLNSFIILNGGSVDIRTEEEILKDNLNAALPSGNGEFEAQFIAEKLDEISEIYKAKNGSGYAVLVDETYIGIDVSKNVLGDIADDIKAKIKTDIEKFEASTLTEIDLSKYSDMPKQVNKAYKTASGNYVFELKASGFGINGDHYFHPSGKHIEIKVSATKDGQIIDCVTTFQAESEGYGSQCADKKFYGQFIGKNKDTYKEIDAISGATITTNGYKTAISKVFAAIEILKGAN